MKAVLLALFVVFSVAACDDDSPSDAPPIGAVPFAGPAAAAPTRVATGVPISGDRAGVDDDASSFDAVSARARRQLDTAWHDCGTGDDAGDARCRDEAMLAYDAALAAARASDTAATAAPVTPPARNGDLALRPVGGTRG